MAITTERHRLYGAVPDGECSDPVRAAIFGHMVRLARPILVRYQSDLYHDAMWLASVIDACTFYYLIRPGTLIYRDAVDADAVAHQLGAVLYRFDLTQDRGTWYLAINRATR